MSNRLELRTFYEIKSKEDIELTLEKLRKMLLIHFELKDPDSKESETDTELSWKSYLSIVINIKEIQESN